VGGRSYAFPGIVCDSDWFRRRRWSCNRNVGRSDVIGARDFRESEGRRMSAQVKAAIAAELALLEKTQDFPVEPFGYGSDISGDSDLDPDLNEVNPFTTLAIAQAVVRRLDCPRGSLPDDPNYGIDLRFYLNRGTATQDIISLGGQIRLEVLKDDRVDTLTVTVKPNPTGSVLTVELAVRPFDPDIGDFSLTLTASDAGVVLEEIRSAL